MEVNQKEKREILIWLAVSQIPQNPYMVLIVFDAAKWDQTVYERTGQTVWWWPAGTGALTRGVVKCSAEYTNRQNTKKRKEKKNAFGGEG